MMKGIFLIFMFVLQHEGASTLIKNDRITEDDTNNHICSRIERYVEENVKQYNETFLEEETVWCLKIPPRCTRYREVTRLTNQTIYVPKTKTIFECCEGYVKKNGKCSAICSSACIHGKCAKPKTCTCEDGWQGPNCNVECDDGWYGEGCKMYCTCQNGATCDKKNGFCHCPPGFAGAFCETICPPESYGKNCENECNCKNGGVCSFTDRLCVCPPGYIGKYCEFQCQDGTYGEKCSKNCSCNDLATIFCSHIDGKCMCVPGWKGDACSNKCDLNTWGSQCSKKCECPPNSICDHVTGDCSCQPGWYGPTCEKKCPEGYFGKDCKMKCPDCMYLPGICHQITGQCSCPPGSRGSNCDLECPENTYGENCIYECSCSNNSFCDPENGDCMCLPGWLGGNCSSPCPIGMYGLNCSLTCNCTDNCTCNPVDGDCECKDPDSLENSVQVLDKIQADATFDESESSWDILIILVIACVLLGILLFIFFVLCITKRAKKSRFCLRKEETSTTNVIQEKSSPTISSYRFMNPNYEATENVNALNRKTRLSLSPTNSFTVKKEDKEVDLEEEDFRIPDCDTASSFEKQSIQILFGNEVTKKGEKIFNSIPGIRYSKTVQSFGVPDEDASSQTNSIYADVEYQTEANSEISKNPIEMKAI